MKTLFSILTALLTSLSAYAQTANFMDISAAAGIDHVGSNYGLAVVDVDQDGWDDIYVTCRNEEPNLMYRNNGDLTFTNVAEEWGIADAGDGRMSVFADFDMDGDLDLYVGNNGQDKLYEQQEDGSFLDVTAAAGVANFHEVRSLNLIQIDNDGDIDLNVSNINEENVLYQNLGEMSFENVTAEYGVSDDQISMGAVAFDHDDDGDTDLYLTHDANQAFIMYECVQGTYFEAADADMGLSLEAQGMGVDVGDFNKDGLKDLYITNLYENSLLIKQEDGTYVDIAGAAGVDDTGMGWGIMSFDYDNDGWQDIYITNESNIPPMQPNRLYRNNGDLTFTDVAVGTPLASPNAGFACAYGDFNNDGMLDIVVANGGFTGNQLFLNMEENDNNWFKLKLNGFATNTVGASVKFYAPPSGGAQELLANDELLGGSGYASQMPYTMHFGLGENNAIYDLGIDWMSGQTIEVAALFANQTLTVNEDGTFPTSVIDETVETIVELSPNPSTDQLNVRLEATQKPTAIAVKVYDVMGRLLLTQQEQNRQFSLNIKDLDAGTYFLQMELNGELLIRPFIKH